MRKKKLNGENKEETTIYKTIANPLVANAFMLHVLYSALLKMIKGILLHTLTQYLESSLKEQNKLKTNKKGKKMNKEISSEELTKLRDQFIKIIEKIRD